MVVPELSHLTKDMTWSIFKLYNVTTCVSLTDVNTTPKYNLVN